MIKKAVLPVAGFGTRFLPASKAIPKEMLPIIDKPLLQYAVEEAINIANRSNVDLHSCNKAEDVAQALSKSLNTSSINVSNNEFLQKLTWHNQSIKLEALFKKILDLEKIHKNRKIDI